MFSVCKVLCMSYCIQLLSCIFSLYFTACLCVKFYTRFQGSSTGNTLNINSNFSLPPFSLVYTNSVNSKFTYCIMVPVNIMYHICLLTQYLTSDTPVRATWSLVCPSAHLEKNKYYTLSHVTDIFLQLWRTYLTSQYELWRLWIWSTEFAGKGRHNLQNTVPCFSQKMEQPSQNEAETWWQHLQINILPDAHDSTGPSSHPVVRYAPFFFFFF